MRTCSNCGNQVGDKAIFCDQCGARLPQQEPAVAQPAVEQLAAEQPTAEQPAVEAVEAAPTGGIPEGVVICPGCGAENVPGEIFCDVCGEALEVLAPAAEVEAETIIQEAVVEEATEVQPAVEEVVAEAAIVEEAAVEETVEQGLYCPVCGSPIHAGDTFCGSCGAALTEAALEEMPTEEPVAVEAAVLEPAVLEPAVLEPIEEPAVLEPAVLEPVSEEPVVQETVVAELPAVEAIVEAPAVGAPVEVPAAAAPAALHCSVCGAEVSPNQAFCASCGAALQVVQEQVVEVVPETIAVGPHLEVMQSGAHIPLVAQAELLVGRLDEVSGIEPEVDLTPHGGLDGGVSRRHARLFYEGNAWFVMDLDSTNGTFVNGKEVAPKTRVPLHDGDKVTFAEVEVIFYAS